MATLAFTVGTSRFTYGAFLTDVLSFLIAAVVVYFVIVVPVSRALKLFQNDQAAGLSRVHDEHPARGPALPAVHRGDRARQGAAAERWLGIQMGG